MKKFKTRTQLLQISFFQANMWPIKEKENRQLLIQWSANSYTLQQAERMCRYGSLLKINPSGIIIAIKVTLKYLFYSFASSHETEASFFVSCCQYKAISMRYLFSFPAYFQEFSFHKLWAGRAKLFSSPLKHYHQMSQK